MEKLFTAALFALLTAKSSAEGISKLISGKIIGGVQSRVKYVVPVMQEEEYLGSASLLSSSRAITSRSIVSKFHKPDYGRAYVPIKYPDTLDSRPHYFEDITYPDNYYNDDNIPDPNFAIIHFNVTIPLSQYVEVISLYNEDFSSDEKGYIIGWGCPHKFIEGLQIPMSSELKELHVKILSHSICEHEYGRVLPTQICTLANSESDEYSYFGDIGDPLIYRTSNADYLMGIVNYFSRNSKHPSLSTKLFSFLGYIGGLLNTDDSRKPQNNHVNKSSDCESCDSNECK